MTDPPLSTSMGIASTTDEYAAVMVRVVLLSFATRRRTIWLQAEGLETLGFDLSKVYAIFRKSILK